MSSMIRNAMIATALYALFAGSAVAEESTTPAMNQERAEQMSQIQNRTEQKTQAQERLQQRLNEQDGMGSEAKARNEYREQRTERQMQHHQMQSRPMGR